MIKNVPSKIKIKLAYYQRTLLILLALFVSGHVLADASSTAKDKSENQSELPPTTLIIESLLIQLNLLGFINQAHLLAEQEINVLRNSKEFSEKQLLNISNEIMLISHPESLKEEILKTMESDLPLEDLISVNDTLFTDEAIKLRKLSKRNFKSAESERLIEYSQSKKNRADRKKKALLTRIDNATLQSQLESELEIIMKKYVAQAKVQPEIDGLVFDENKYAKALPKLQKENLAKHQGIQLKLNTYAYRDMGREVLERYTQLHESETTIRFYQSFRESLFSSLEKLRKEKAGF